MKNFLQRFRPQADHSVTIPKVNYELGNKPLFLDLNINRHIKLKAYSALINKTMIQTVNEWIDSLKLKEIH